MSTNAVQAVEDTIVSLCDKIKETVTMGKPDETVKYTEALQQTASAYEDIKDAGI